MTHNMVVGTSEAQDFRLVNDDEDFNGTGFTVAIEFSLGTPTGAVLSVNWLSASAGTVRVTGTETLPVGEHKFRFAVTDGSAHKGYFPSLKVPPDLWYVYPV